MREKLDNTVEESKVSKYFERENTDKIRSLIISTRSGITTEKTSVT